MAEKSSTPDDKPMDRRRFFRRGLAELMKPLGAAIAPLERAAHQIGNLEAHAQRQAQQARQPNRVPLNVWLRPPGALPEKQFKETCTACGTCVKVCPAHCIRIDATGNHGDGAAYIEPNLMACVVCDGLYCMDQCPTGALVPTAITDIDMGTAVWNANLCVRPKGQDCRICVDQCPIGEVAIAVNGDQIEVKPLGCIGCGMCQHYCPTNPKSINVIPVAAKSAPQ